MFCLTKRLRCLALSACGGKHSKDWEASTVFLLSFSGVFLCVFFFVCVFFFCFLVFFFFLCVFF